uniref:WD repeat-containing protein 7 n=1 Tax=Aceria tosichella TaxID=561515 RepID=A0A6G1SN68_9ACAR
MSERLVLPFALWGSKAPTHRISCIHMMHNERNLITGSHDGQICTWEVEHDPVLSITPISMIFGHTAPVLCIADGDFVTNNTIVTSSDNGELCSWNVDDGQCLETKKTQYIHTYMQSFKVSTKDCRLFCVGHYAEILVLEPKTFSIKFRLSSKDQPDWITSIHILQPPQLSNIVIIGLSINGIVRIWTITDETNRSLDPIYDNDRKALDCSKSVQIISNPESMRLILIVCPERWDIYDATDFTKLCTVEAGKFRWTGGNFLTRDQVLVWSDKGEGYLYQVTTKRGVDNNQSSTTRLKAHLSSKTDKRFLYPPRMCLSSTSSSGKLLVRGDHRGAITIWSLISTNTVSDQVLNVSPKYHQSLENVWKQAHIEQLQSNLSSECNVTCSAYLPALGKLACAREDGTIIITTVTHLALLRLYSDAIKELEDGSQSQKATDERILSGHVGRINCLLYPNGTSPRYDEKYLVSGGIDFAVCLWDVTTGDLLHKFFTQAGEITQFLIPPNGCSAKLQTSICCVALDHSVSILNLNEKKCTLLAGRQLFPVQVIKWKPTDDTMVVGCKDDSAYVWRLETGQLAKVLQGAAAQETLSACDESVVTKEEQTNPAIELFKGLKQGNLSAIKSAAAKGLNQLAAQHNQPKVDYDASYRSHPLTIQNLKANPQDNDAYVIFFDIESIIAYLLHEPNLVIETVSILLSILQAWGLGEEANKICVNNPEMLKEFKPACLGLISKSCYMALMLPSYVRKLEPAIRRSRFFAKNSSLARLTGQCLSTLLFVTSSAGLPLYTSLRFTAVKLIGRGFTFWESYLDVAKVLLGLLDLSWDQDPKSNSDPSDRTTNPQSTSRQAARDALSAIALARPSVFITTLAREIAKYNSKQSNAHSRVSNHGQQNPPTLVKSKMEILRNITIMIETMPLDVANLIVETMDIVLHCIDHSLLENRGLGEAFPAITRFYMVSYCSSSRRIAVGTVTGNLAMYELRAQSKPQIVPAHKSAVSACSFSPDGKYLASYSAGDNKLCFWLTATGLFGLGNARTRCVGAIDTPPVSADLIKSPSDLLRVARLIWVAGKVVILMFIDEREFRYQVAS